MRRMPGRLHPAQGADTNSDNETAKVASVTAAPSEGLSPPSPVQPTVTNANIEVAAKSVTPLNPSVHVDTLCFDRSSCVRRR